MQDNIRLNKYLSEAGICSRREADRLIEAGKVTINGKPALVGARVCPGDDVRLDRKKVELGQKPVLIAFYKPRGIVCTFEKREHNNIIDYIGFPQRITYAGRLDRESEGLMIMTNQGVLLNRMMRAGNGHEKEYEVTVDKPVTAGFIEQMSNGMMLEEIGVQTRKCRVWKTGARSFHIILTQGINRQIRRMCRMCGYHVKKLVRLRIMNIELGSLEKGSWRNLNKNEIKGLYRALDMDVPDGLIPEE